VNPKLMNTKLQLACAWLGPVFVFMFFLGLVPLAQFVPPPSPNASASTIGHLYRDDPTRVRLGLLLMTMSTALTIPWGLTIATWTKRAEGRYSLLTYAQIICIGISSLVGADLQASAQGVFQGASGFAVLAAGLWAGFLWGADGRLPLLISGVVGGVFALALLAVSAYDRTGTSNSTSSSAKGGSPTPTTE